MSNLYDKEKEIIEILEKSKESKTTVSPIMLRYNDIESILWITKEIADRMKKEFPDKRLERMIDSVVGDFYTGVKDIYSEVRRVRETLRQKELNNEG